MSKLYCIFKSQSKKVQPFKNGYNLNQRVKLDNTTVGLKALKLNNKIILISIINNQHLA